MPRYIDADDFFRQFSELDIEPYNNVSTIEIEERPKGKWIERVEHRGCYLGVKTVYSYTCPFCGVKEYEKHPFCHCGADMRGEEE